MRSLGTIAVLLAALGAAGCQFDRAPLAADAVDATMFPGPGVGDPCDVGAAEPCREGLSCRSGTCAAAGTTGRDGKCLLTDECAADLACGWSGFCEPAGHGREGVACSSASDCARGLACRLVGFVGFCTAPRADAGDLGAPCGDLADCKAGLACSPVSGTCVAGSVLLNPDAFAGIACPDESGLPFGVRTRVPREGTATPFYDLPFPSDVRRVDGRLALEDHPRPGPGILGFDPLDGVLRALEREADGFALGGDVQMRLTRPVDPATVVPGASVRLVDLATGLDVPARARFVPQRTKYDCGNRLVVRAAWDRVLTPRTSYAVLVTRALRSTDDPPRAAGAIDDLPALLAPTAPADPALAAAWKAYLPLRAWMKRTGVDAASLAGATVFTTGDPAARARALPDAVAAADMPTLRDVTVCGPGVVSPCATPGWAATPEGRIGKPDPRGCPSSSRGLTEIHARLRMPSFQEGTPPYLDEGGGFHLAGGRPAVTRYEDVCVAFAIPEGEPEGGWWPVVIYGHGTGGDFRLAMDGVARRLAPRGIAVLSWDGPLHGPRRGIDRDPGPLFYNYRNPPAAQGNVLQGAADAFALMRFAKSFSGMLGAVGPVRFGRVMYYGHSQGATTGALFVPYPSGLAGAVLTGCGAALSVGLLGKKLPQDASLGARMALQELELDADHPGMQVLQAYFEPSDALVHAPAFLRDPPGQGVSLLHVVGWDDRYAPWQSQFVFDAALGIPLVLPDRRPADLDTAGFDPVADLGIPTVTGAVSGNLPGTADTPRTAAVVAGVGSATSDGHFVAETDPGIRARVDAFLDSAAHGPWPTLPAEAP